MSKGLEALKKFADDINQCVNSGGVHYIDKRNYDIIEKELKEKEEILDALSKMSYQCGNLLKYKKAVEIIKKKIISLTEFTMIKKSGDKNYYYTIGENGNEVLYLSQEEYIFLKEVMADE